MFTAPSRKLANELPLVESPALRLSTDCRECKRAGHARLDEPNFPVHADLAAELEGVLALVQLRFSSIV